MRLNLRLKFKGVTFYAMLAQHQTLYGISNRISKEKDEYAVFWDLEKCSIPAVERVLFKIQRKYKLGTIYISSDCKNSARAWCFTRVSWKRYLEILLNTKYCCYNFFYWTVRRGHSTLRLTKKEGRIPQKLVSTLRSPKKETFPTKLMRVKYDTGKQKIGVVCAIG